MARMASAFGVGVAALVACCAAPTQGEDAFAFPDESGAEATDQGRLPESLRLSGDLEYKFFGQFQKARNDRARDNHEVVLSLDTVYDLGDAATLTMEPVLRWDNRHFSAGVIDKLRDRDKRRPHLDLHEGYLTVRTDNADIHLGKRIYSWGKADAFNPTDNLNPYDLLDFPDSEKMGIFSLAVEYSQVNYGIDLVFSPLFTPSRLPEPDNRWFPQDLLGLPGQMRDRDLPSNTLGNSQFAGRFRFTLHGWDFALSYYHGLDHIPVVERRMTVQPRVINNVVVPVPVPVFTPVHNRFNEFGLGTATTFGEVEFHTEAAYHDTENDNDDDFVTYVIGGSYGWDMLDFWGWEIERIAIHLEYAREHTVETKDNPDRLSAAAGLSRPSRKAILSRIQVTLNEDMDFKCEGAYNIDHDDFFVEPKLTWKFRNQWELTVGLDFLEGHSRTFFGKWNKNDRVFASLVRHF